uniref:Uncharacterized protein n=1 Tax=Anopheles maculatus TaxID=74869 RepID=A0A182TBD8_9DIPT
MDPVEQMFSRDLAIMVYHYMLEWRMENVAQLFAAKCPVLSNEERLPDRGLLSIIPYRRLHDTMLEYSKLLISMRRTIQDYHTEVPVPFGATTWDKIKFIIDYFHTKSTIQATEVTIEEGNDTDVVFATPTAPPTTVGGVDVGTENFYQLLEVNQPSAPMANLTLVPENHHIAPSDPCTSNTEEEQIATDTPMVLFVQNGARQALDNGTFFVSMNQLQLSEEMPNTVPISFLTLDEGVVIRQQDESDAVLAEQTNPIPAEPSLPSLPTLEEDDASLQMAKPTIVLASEEAVSTEPDNNLLSEAPNQATLPPNLTAPEVNSLAENDQAAQLPALANDKQDAQEHYWQELLAPVTMAEPVQPSSALSNQPADNNPPTTRKPVDLEALAQWKQSRSIDSSNWDNHIRQLNYEMEQKKEKILLEGQKKKKTPNKQKTPTKQKTPIVKSEHNIRTVVKTAKKSGKTRPLAAAAERKQQPLDESDSSDFASSPDEDADVRKMYESVKQYRKKKKKLATKENQLAAQSNAAPSTSLPLCRKNHNVGRTLPVSPVKRSLRKRTHSTSPDGGTPVKCTKQSPTVSDNNTTVPSTSSTGRRVGIAKSAKKVKQTEQQNAAAKPSTARDVLSLPVVAPLSPKNRRPVRACTMHRKTMLTASTPLKATAPNGENMPPSGTLGSPEPESKSYMKPETIEGIASADTVDAGEAAIYAVLAQLHGD